MFAGLTRPESEAVAQWLEGFDASGRTAALIPIELGVVLSDGAGPHLLDVSGALVLVVEALEVEAVVHLTEVLTVSVEVVLVQ